MHPTSLPERDESMPGSRQWRDFLAATAAEFVEALPREDLRLLMHRIGERFAAAQRLPPCRTLQALDAAVNALWQRIDWGQATFTEQYTQLQIVHRGAPLAANFGPDADWTIGFLEGVYQAWFVQCGMPYGLAVSVDAAGDYQIDDPDAITLRMARAD